MHTHTTYQTVSANASKGVAYYIAMGRVVFIGNQGSVFAGTLINIRLLHKPDKTSNAIRLIVQP